MTSQIGPDQFRQFVTPAVAPVFAALRTAGTLGSFFVCGHAQQNLEAMCECGPDNISVDENIPLQAVREICEARGVSYGRNLQLTSVLLLLLGLPEIRDRRPVVLINEFGTLGVDAQRLGPGAVGIFEINRGSLFCTCTRGTLLEALGTIRQQDQAGIVLVEATGISETQDLEALLDEPVLAGAFTIQANLCIVDAEHFTKVAGVLRAPASQVAAADGLILNKADRVGPDEHERLQRLLTSLNPTAPQIAVNHGRVGWDFVTGMTHRRAREALSNAPPPQIGAVTFEHPGQADREAFQDALGRLGDHLLRLKGHVRFTDGLRSVDLAGGHWHEDEPRPGAAATAFTAIIWAIPKGTAAAALRDAFQA